jgi:ABC-type uncharacterized transport system permease subunit
MIGFFRSAFWPFVLSMIAYHKSISDESTTGANLSKCIMTIWAIGYEAGVIAGFLASSILFYNLNVSWENCILFGAAINLGATCFIYFFLRNYMEDRTPINLNSLSGVEVEVEPETLITMG